MKTVKLTIYAVLASALLLGCTREETDGEGYGRRVKLTVHAGQVDETKTGISYDGSFFWSAGDAITLFETTPETFNVYESAAGATTDGGQTMTFSVSLDPRNAASFSYSAVFPKTAVHANPTSVSAVAINIPSVQTPAAHTFDKGADLLISRPVNTGSVQPASIDMEFTRPLAVGNITITGIGANEPVRSITFSAVKGGNAVPVAGATTFNLLTARPTGAYGDAQAAADLVIDCESIDPSALSGSAASYTVSDFDWDFETSTVVDPASDLKGNGVFFTCWPFELGAGDSFKVVVRAGGNTYTKNVVIPSGRSFSMPEANVGSFTVNMAGVTPVYSPDDYYSLWEAGEDLVIGGRTYNKATYGAGTLIEDGATLPARTGVYFIDTDATVALTGSYSSTAGNLIIVGRTPGNRPTVNKSSAPCYYNGEGASVALFNINFVANSVPAFTTTAKLAALDIEDCSLAVGLFYGQNDDNNGFENVCIKNNKIALCKEDVQSGNRDNGVTRGIKNSSMTKFEFIGNTVYPRNNVPSKFGFNQDLTSGKTSTVQEVVFKDNLFVDISPYKAFANWTNDYKLTVTGNIIDFNGIRSDSVSASSDSSELDYFAQRNSGEALTDVTEGGNAVYYTNQSRFSTSVVRQPLSQNNRYQVAVPQETVLASRDFTTGEFPLKPGALYAEAFTADGTRYWGSVDCTAHKIYINHVPRADMITEVKIWPESCECSALSGSWPNKTISVDDIQYDVVLPDYVSGTPLSGYTLQWADEFTLGHVERQAWRNTGTGGGASGYLCPDDSSLETVSDGALHLWYRTTSNSGVGYWPSGVSTGYVAGGLDSRYRRGFSFGQDARMEVRMKWNEMAGLWQAAWMLADPNQGFGSDRRCVGGEIDIIEHLASQKTMFQTLHTENTVTNETPYNCGQARVDKNTHNDTWFTFGVEVVNAGTSSATVKFYIDGVQSTWYKATSKILWWETVDEDFSVYVPKSYWSGRSSTYGFGYYWPFDLFEYCMILTAQVGGNWCGEPDGTAISAGSKEMTVDYVRYYTKN